MNSFELVLGYTIVMMALIALREWGPLVIYVAGLLPVVAAALRKGT